MTTATQNASSFQTKKSPLTLSAIVAALFMINLRDSLATASADQSDAAFAYGL